MQLARFVDSLFSLKLRVPLLPFVVSSNPSFSIFDRENGSKRETKEFFLAHFAIFVVYLSIQA